ncbi:MAG: peptidoglycan DD-metalloendopeptidase family protein [Candidatus Rokubacteria bacterium]|nr:peptidoglycan DD-metalloendopeptidase family protein [Candidatus Rokubacteria bacterium]
MMPWRFLYLLLALAVLAAPAWAQKRDDPTLRQSERTLQQTQKQLKEERAKAAQARQRETSLLSELEAIELTLEKKRRELEALGRRIRKAQSEIQTLEGEIRRLEAQRATQQEILARRLRAMYKLQAQGGALPLLLAVDDPMARAVQLRHLTTLAAVDARLIREYRGTSEHVAERKGRVEEQRQELSSLRAQVERERGEVDREAARRRVLLAKVREERAYHERMVGELSEAAKRLEALIRDLQARQRRVAKAPPPGKGGEPPAVGFGTLRGSLPWPTDGRIVSAFGEQVHPRFGTRTFKRGIDIEADDGAQITAVYAGHVVYTGWFKGYGNLIILDHGNDFYTLYAHAAEIRVKEGDDVRPGQLIGTVGDTGSLAGPRLYFEVRYQGRPQDPAEWLRRRG